MNLTASLSLDLDNKWSYMKTHGDSKWHSFPSYLDVLVPRVLQFLKERNLTITFFVVGQDAALEKNRDALASISAAGHEIGNHSFHHEPWLHLYSEQQIETEIARAEEHIQRASGQKPIGFRGPGFSLSHATLEVLVRRGYLYDASTLPTFIGPLARAYYFMTAKLTPEQRIQRKALFGSFSEGLRPIRPYRWQVDTRGLIEIPVTTMPLFKVPIHVSYVLYLSMCTPALASLYFRLALRLCRLTGTEPSLLLHPLDFLGAEDTRDLSFFPGMTLSGKKKLEMVSNILDILSAQFSLTTLKQHAQKIAFGSNLKLVPPKFYCAD
jgi:peptidoglycan/xylan/chitin deacetylase (PgdA/CDA1 family)